VEPEAKPHCQARNSLFIGAGLDGKHLTPNFWATLLAQATCRFWCAMLQPSEWQEDSAFGIRIAAHSGLA
jgi:hypothetical protein